MMDFSWVGVVVAAIASFTVGGIYYGLLGKPWMKAARLDPLNAKMGVSVFVISIFAEIIMAIVISGLLANYQSNDVTILLGLKFGFLLWLGVSITTLSINHRYQGFGWSLTLIDGMHWLLVLLVQGAIVGFFGAPVLT